MILQGPAGAGIPMAAKWYIALGGAAILLLLAWLNFRGEPWPDREAATLSDAVARGDWRYVFRQSSPKERSVQRWSEEQFVSLMSQLTAGQEANLTQLKLTQAGGDPESGTVVYSVKFQTTSQSHGDGFKRTYPLLKGRRSKLGWHFDLATWPFAVAWLHRGTAREQLAHFYEAAQVAGIEEFRSLDVAYVVTSDRIRAMAAGEVPLTHL